MTALGPTTPRLYGNSKCLIPLVVPHDMRVDLGYWMFGLLCCPMVFVLFLWLRGSFSVAMNYKDWSTKVCELAMKSKAHN